LHQIIETRLRAILEEQGFSGCGNFSWELGYSQGDGVDFSGRIDNPAALIDRLLGSEEAEALKLPFAADPDDARVNIKTVRYGQCTGLVAEIECDEALEPKSTDTGHDLLKKEIASQSLPGFEKALHQELKRVQRLLREGGYAVSEACDPAWWTDLPRVETRHGRYVVLKRRLLGHLVVEWRLAEVSDQIDEDQAEFYHEIITGGGHCGQIACALLIRDEDEDETEIVCSPSIGFIVKAGQDVEKALHSDMRLALEHAVEEHRSRDS
jgi:hypothetical protein